LQEDSRIRDHSTGGIAHMPLHDWRSCLCLRLSVRCTDRDHGADSENANGDDAPCLSEMAEGHADGSWKNAATST
jgi:hypothetical protein